MRTLLPVLVAAVLGAGLWLLFGGPPGRAPVAPVPKSPSQLELEENPRLGYRTTRLVVHAQGPDGRLPPGAEVGYQTERGDPHWVYAEEPAGRAFDAPLGRVYVMARAPGYPVVRQPVDLISGLPHEHVVPLEPTR